MSAFMWVPGGFPAEVVLSYATRRIQVDAATGMVLVEVPDSAIDQARRDGAIEAILEEDTP